MRVAFFVVSMFVVAAPSQASETCRSLAEARQHFGSVHLYWHGPNHCWDTAPGRQFQVQRIRQRTSRIVQQEVPKWREAMSELLPVQASVEARGTETPRSDGETNDPAVGRSNWRDRWVDFAQIAPQSRTENQRDLAVASPTTRSSAASPVLVTVILCFGLVLLLVTAEVVLRNSRYGEVAKG